MYNINTKTTLLLDFKVNDRLSAIIKYFNIHPMFLITSVNSPILSYH